MIVRQLCSRVGNSVNLVGSSMIASEGSCVVLWSCILFCSRVNYVNSSLVVYITR